MRNGANRSYLTDVTIDFERFAPRRARAHAPAAARLAALFLFSAAIAVAQDHAARFEQVDGLIYLDVSVNGSAPLPFLLDTGATGTVVSAATARIAGLQSSGESIPIGGPGSGPGSGEASIEGQGKSSEGEIVRGVSLRAGGFELPPQEVVVASFGAVTAGAGHRTAGILSVARLPAVEIDYSANLIRFKDPGNEPPESGIPLRFERRFPLIHAEIGLPQGGTAGGTFLIDTGAKLAGLILTRSFLNRHPEILQCGEHPPIPSIAVFGGVMELEGGRVASLQVGNYSLPQPFTLFARSPSKLFEETGIDGVIGTQILSRFRIGLDLAHGRLFLKANASLDEPLLADASGLRVNVVPPDFHRFKIIAVMKQSPADEAAMQAGDVLEEIGGKAADDLDLAEVRRLLSLPNRRYALTVLRGDDEMHFDLATRELFSYTSCAQAPTGQ